MKRLVVVFGCILIITGLIVYANTSRETVRYSREELEELFDALPVVHLNEEFENKRIQLADPFELQDFEALVATLSVVDAQPFVSDGEESTMSSGICSDGKPFALLEKEEARFLGIETKNAGDVTDRWYHQYHQKSGEDAITEIFYKNDTKQSVKLTFEGADGVLSSSW